MGVLRKVDVVVVAVRGGRRVVVGKVCVCGRVYVAVAPAPPLAGPPPSRPVNHPALSPAHPPLRRLHYMQYSNLNVHGEYIRLNLGAAHLYIYIYIV